MRHRYYLSTWFNSLTLSERISLFKSSGKQYFKNINADIAKRCYKYWYSLFPLKDKIYLKKWFWMMNISESEFHHILGLSVDNYLHQFVDLPSWVNRLKEAFTGRIPKSRWSISSRIERYKNRSLFLTSIKPLIIYGFLQLEKKINAFAKSQPLINKLIDPESFIDIQFSNLIDILIMMVGRTFVLELNIFRLQGRLKGSTPDARFFNFIRQISRKKNAFAILKQYPVLARQLLNTIDNWVSFSFEFLGHFCSDYNNILKKFCDGRDPGRITNIKSSGDIHRSGRSVLIVEFESGFKIVYKPRSMAIDLHFQQLLKWINNSIGHNFFPIVKIMNCGHYGWMEFVPYKPCTVKEEISRFYERIGGYIALTYMLYGTDFHFENLIANGEYPILVDLESLFHPPVGEKDSSEAEYLASNIVINSVMRTGLLPQRIFAKDNYAGVDLSGVSQVKGQPAPDEVHILKNIYTDKMMFERKQSIMRGAYNQPKIDGNNTNVLSYIDEIINGYSYIYRFLLQSREKLLSRSGPIMNFAGDEIRILIRPTRTYFLLLYESFHPHFLTNGLNRDFFFNKLWVAVENHPYLIELIPSEKEDLENNNIPVFLTYTNSHDLYNSRGKRFSNFFKRDALSLVKSRIKKLSNEDLENQIYFIRMSIATLERARHTNQVVQLPKSNTKIRNYRYKTLRNWAIKKALDMGNKLVSNAIRGKKNVSWIGLTFDKEGYLYLGPLGTDLYSGIPGIILFLAYLGEVTGIKKFRSISQEALVTLRRLMKANKRWIKSIGAFTGWGGIIYTLSHLGTLWRKPSLFDEAIDLVLSNIDLVEKDRYYDVMAGTAGYILSLINLYSCKPSNKVVDIAIKCGDHLVNNSRPLKSGIGWCTVSKEPIGGFAHGSAGISLALLKLASLTKNKRFKTAAFNSMAFERSLFVPKEQNWITWYPADEHPATGVVNKKQTIFPVAWCHGATGIGIGRLNMLEYIDDNDIKDEIKIAIKKTLEHGFGYNHSLCHGDFGNMDFLLSASTIDKYKYLRKSVNQIAGEILTGIDKYGLRFTNKFQVETCGLMIGLAGIGYECLRIAEPNQVPSILSLSLSI